MNILVTGGAGYIGSVVTDEVLDCGHSVVVVDNLSTGHRDAVDDRATFIEGDIGDETSVKKALSEHAIEAVIHLAASSLVEESVRSPEKYRQNNIVNGQRLLDAMHAAGVRKIVFSSTAAVYGEPERIPIEETDSLRPTNPYGETKLEFERLLAGYEREHGIRYVSLRYFNAAGACRTRGERHATETHLIPLVLNAALGKIPQIRVFGDDYPTPDGTCLRDYVHVVDLARAHVLALDVLQSRSDIYNLGGGRGYSVREVIDTARRVTGRDIPEEKAMRRPGDPAVLIASSAKIMNDLGWTPEFQDLGAIIESAWSWLQKGGIHDTK